MRKIANHELRVTQIPRTDSMWEEIQEFALTFDGYKSWGSFEKCAEVANAQRDDTLTEMRTCLFFEQRRWRHFGEDPDKDSMDYIRELVKKIREKVVSEEIE